MTEPYSDRYSRLLLGLWTTSTVLAMGSLALGIMIPSPLAPVWVVINSVTTAFDVTMLMWSVQGHYYRKSVNARKADDRTFMEIMINAYADGK